MEENVKTLGDYLAILRRRKKPFFVASLVLVAVTVVLAVALPSVYQSQAVILIEQPDVPSTLVQSTASTYADQRVQMIQQRVMTNQNLIKIMDKYHLYASDRSTMTTEQLVAEMRDDIDQELISANVINPRTGQPSQATIAFSLAYENKSPALAQKVTNELVSLYLNANVQESTQQATEASQFLADQAKRVQAHIADITRRLAAFKRKHVGELPQLTQLNFEMLDRNDRELMDVEQQIRSLEQHEASLKGQLAQLSPYTELVSSTGQRILTPTDRLKALESDYVSKSAIYGPDFPDLVKMRREIDALTQEVGAKSDPGDLEATLEATRADLATAEKRYSPNYPDVKRLKRTVAALTKALKEAKKQAASNPHQDQVTDATNPAYILLQAQLNGTEKNLASYRKQAADLHKKLKSYEARITNTPEVEREYEDLTNEYNLALDNYKGIKAKLDQATLGEQMEKGNKGERFSLIQPPLMPEQPVKPNRLAILFLGLVLSLGGGLGAVVVTESLDTSVRGAYGVAAILGAGPLGAIPVIFNDEEQRKSRRWIWLGLLGILIALLVGLVLINFFYMPLDVLWFTIERKLGLLAASGG